MSVSLVTNNAVSAFNHGNIEVGFVKLALTTFVLHIISNLPKAKAMDETGLQVCLAQCRQRSAGAELERCTQRCYNTYLSTTSDL